MFGLLFTYDVIYTSGSRDSVLAERRTRDRKVAGSNPGRSGGRIIFSRKKTLRADSYSVKDPDHFANSAGGRLHLNMHTPLTQRSRSELSMPLSRHRVGTYQETISHATCQGTLSHSRLSWISHCGLNQT